jgi:hypothetical protein
MAADEGYAQIGNLLRHARMEKAMPLEVAARRLHIRPRYLHALEEGLLSELPGHAYAKGYVQRYAQLLELDIREVMRRFEQMEGHLTRRAFYFPQVFSKEKKATSPMVYYGIGAAVLAYGLWALVLAPARQAISVVDVPHKPVVEAARPAFPLLRDEACLRAPDTLYPPCYARPVPEGLRWPYRRPTQSILDIAL